MRKTAGVCVLTLALLAGVAPAAVQAKRIKMALWTFSTGVYYDRLVWGAEQYKKKNPNVDITVTAVGEMNQKLKVSLASGTGPDITVVNGGLIETWNMPFMLKPLEAYLKASASTDKYVKASIASVTNNGHVYALPWVVDANFPVVYNRDAFAEVGLPDRAPKDPAETIEFSQKVTKKDASGRLQRVWLVPWDWEQTALHNWAMAFSPEQQSDGVRWKFTGDNTLKALDFYIKLASACGGAAPLDAFMVPLRWSPTIKKFCIRPQVVPQIYSILQAEKNVRVGIGDFPTTPSGANSVWLAGHWLGLGVRCKYPKEAFDFVRWMTLDLEVQKANRQFFFSGAKEAYEPNLYSQGPKGDPMTPLLAFAASLVPKGGRKLEGILRDEELFAKFLQDIVVRQKTTPLQGMQEYERVINKRIDEKVGRMKGRITDK